MKIRNGFVSNSSTGSFIVKLLDREGTEVIRLLTKEQEDALIRFGFVRTLHYDPSTYVDSRGEISEEESELWAPLYLAHRVCANFEDVVSFLVKLNVPFIGTNHYDQYLMIWEGDGHKVIEVPNLNELFFRNKEMPKDIKKREINPQDF